MVETQSQNIFPDDSGSETGAKNDGKGIAELGATSNEEISKQLKIAADHKVDNPEVVIAKERDQKNAKNESRQKEKTPKQNLHLHKKTHQHNNNQAQIKENTKKFEDGTQDLKAIMNFVNKLDPDVREKLKSNLKKKLAVVEQRKQDQTDASAKQSHQNLIDKKRGVHKQPTVLELAKKVAEQTRKMVKAARAKVLGEKVEKTTTTPPIHNDQSKKKDIKNRAKKER